MSVDLPSLDLLRSLSDRHVLAAVASSPGVTRAAVAATTGLSKPTVSQSVARLLDTGVLAEGERTTGGRGRAGTTLTVDAAAGCALAVQAGPGGVVGELVALDGRILATRRRAVSVPVTSRALGRALVEVCRALASDSPGPVRVVTVSVADPVDRRTGRVVELPESPFLVGELDVVDLLEGVVPVRPVVDNDVSWALLAEQARGVAAGVDDVLQLYLDDGMGAAILTGGRLLHGSRGLAGEIAYAQAHAPARGSRRAVSDTLIGCVEALGYLQPRGRAVDTTRLVADLDADRPTALAVAEAVAGVARAHAYLLDPELVVLSGGWGRHTRIVDAVTTTLGDAGGVTATVAPAEVTDDAPLVGARATAVDALLDTWLVA
ncbi:putative NBD/HSP70 family sugar kinase [Knoellia remsis]|uniref:Putative NBD/HSP70 family sugar kinase n=1 Tax=Knoellia remsis TaxID=407159 RepID=A0A2T0UQC2_9MICO|nr:ROK family transcriptional regulator [Knoellia remsis]PRY60106.1 putative NBD/HSP70 family sugar kinase [Knoellia remsis]